MKTHYEAMGELHRIAVVDASPSEPISSLAMRCTVGFGPVRTASQLVVQVRVGRPHANCRPLRGALPEDVVDGCGCGDVKRLKMEDASAVRDRRQYTCTARAALG